MMGQNSFHNEDEGRGLTKCGRDAMLRMLSDQRKREVWGDLAKVEPAVPDKLFDMDRLMKALDIADDKIGV